MTNRERRPVHCIRRSHPCESRRPSLKEVKVQLENCYGIRALNQDFDFSKKPLTPSTRPTGKLYDRLSGLKWPY